ncbi:MAG: hypothetical protein HC927_14175 [Deltaproteobacteria bacterium]|nr:hypothetical protein [Deltaproteobacteria bacterium]
MASRILRTNLLLSVTLIAGCPGGEEETDSNPFTDDDEIGDTTMGTTDDGMEGSESADSMMDSSSTTDDPDESTTDDPDESTTNDPDESESETSTETGPPECLDLDLDGYGDNCDLGPDCDDADFNNWTSCATCMDADGDNYWTGCDQFDDQKQGPDCDDANYNAFSELGCMNCVDGDMDGFWKGCDQYGDQAPGPDCNDANAGVGVQDNEEICNGLAENCAGEIDNQPPDDMCPTDGMEPPNVAPMNGWLCDPPAAGVDGCKIANCVEQYFNIDGDDDNGCECAGTPRTKSLAACSDAPQGYLGNLAEGQQLNGLVVGSIPLIDNGVGNGAEDWFSVDIPEPGNPGTRPNTGRIQIDFQQNDNTDYRFTVHRTCASVAFDGGLATQFGNGAPPAREWWFFDNHTPPLQMPVPALYKDNVTWPSKVYVRVFRVQNDKVCNSYQLRVQRVSN